MIAQAFASGSRRGAHGYQARILPEVSRTFALTIPQLDVRLRTVIANAYLLCRIADTIEDENALPGDVKQQFHDRFTRVVEATEDPASFARDLAPLLTGNTAWGWRPPPAASAPRHRTARRRRPAGWPTRSR